MGSKRVVNLFDDPWRTGTVVNPHDKVAFNFAQAKGNILFVELGLRWVEELLGRTGGFDSVLNRFAGQAVTAQKLILNVLGASQVIVILWVRGDDVDTAIRDTAGEFFSVLRGFSGV